MADSGSPRNSGEQANASTSTTGVAGLFADLMAQALSPGSPASTKSIPQPGKTTAELNDENQQSFAEQALKNANLQFGKNPLQGVQVMGGNSIGVTITTRNPAGQSNAIQSNPGTAAKPAEKAGEAGKSEKNSQPAQPDVGPNLNEALMNQMIAGTIPVVSPVPVPIPPVKLELKSIPSVPERATLGESVTGFVAAAQTRKNSGILTRSSNSDVPEKETVAASQPAGVPTPGQLTAESAASAVKNEKNVASLDAMANFSQTKAAANVSEHQSINDGQSAPQPSSDSNGTSAAKQDISVKQAEKTNNIAGQTEKVLPGNAAILAQANARLPLSSHPEQVAATVPASSDASEISVAAAAPAVHSAVVSGTITPAVERMQEMVTLNAVRLSDSGNNSMQVVIKPDSGTQLSLELRQHGGSVAVQAALQQGNFNHLSQQWPELQQRLGQRGIQLAPLADDAPSTHGGADGSFQQNQQQTTEPVAEDHYASIRQALPAIAHAPVIASEPAQQGWESWA